MYSCPAHTISFPHNQSPLWCERPSEIMQIFTMKMDGDSRSNLWEQRAMSVYGVGSGVRCQVGWDAVITDWFVPSSNPIISLVNTNHPFVSFVAIRSSMYLLLFIFVCCLLPSNPRWVRAFPRIFAHNLGQTTVQMTSVVFPKYVPYIAAAAVPMVIVMLRNNPLVQSLLKSTTMGISSLVYKY